MMTQASKWRIELARKIAPVYANNPKVKAVIVGGSVSCGVADRYSDVEIGVFWSEPPSDEERRAAGRRIGIYGSFPTFPENSETPDDGADEDIYVGGNRETGFQVDVKHRTVEATERLLNHPESGVSHVIQSAIPLYGHALIERWKNGIIPRPKELATREIENCLGRLGAWWFWESFVQDDERMRICGKFTDILEYITVVLRWLNDSHHINYIKWTERAIQELQIAPHNYWVRYQRIYRETPTIGMQQLRLLVEETLDLVGTHLMEVDVESFRETIFTKSPRWFIRSAVKRAELSRWQNDLLNTLTRAYASNPNVEAMMLSGLVRRISYPAHLECTVFWTDPPSETERRRTIQAVGGTPKSIEPFDAKQALGRDNYDVGGVNLDVQHVTIGQITSVLTSVVSQFDPSMNKQAMIATLTHGIPLHNENLIQQWQKKTTLYPDELVQSTVSQILSDFDWTWSNRVEIYAHRDGSLFFRWLFTYQAQEVLKILMSLNRMYVPKYGNRLNPFIEALQITPPNFASRFKKMFRLSPVNAVDELRLLIEETFSLIEMNFPAIDTKAAREKFMHERRKPWDDPPTGILSA